MGATELSWEGYEVDTQEAAWVCTRSVFREVGFASPPTFLVDGIDYFLGFSAPNKRSAKAPGARGLQLCTSEYLVGTDLGFLKLVVDGQLLQTTPWDRVKEVYRRD